MKKFKIPKKTPPKAIENFFKKKGLSYLVKLSKSPNAKVNQLIEKEPYKPDLKDLFRLYHFVYLNKRTTVLEFGSGWSSLIISLALNDLKREFHKEIAKLRRNNPFEIFIVENEKNI